MESTGLGSRLAVLPGSSVSKSGGGGSATKAHSTLAPRHHQRALEGVPLKAASGRRSLVESWTGTCADGTESFHGDTDDSIIILSI